MAEEAQMAQDLVGEEGRKDEAIKVSVRVRPMNAREMERGAGTSIDELWQCESNTISMLQNGKPAPSASFAFDNLFDPETTNQQLYQEVAQSHPASVVGGYDSVIFAYGMTSSGKTHTMMGTEDDPGVTPRAVHGLFKAVAATENRNFFIRVSYIEIYNEIIRDLLAPGNDNLKVHEDWSGKVFVEAVEQIVGSAEHVLQIMRQGEENRTFGATQMNERSSRSHTIFSLRVQSTVMSSEEEVKEEGRAVRQSSLSLVDLAGSERASSSGAEGVRLKEGGHINKSLLVLGNVINKLSEGNLSHVPYRDSKLTRVLQSALGGNAKTSIICAVTPAPMHVEETCSTLKFASRAKKITNTMHCNEILDDRALIRRQQKEILRLRAMVSGGVGPAGTERECGTSPKSGSLTVNNAHLEEKIFKLQKLLQAAQSCGTPTNPKKRPKRRLSTSDLELRATSGAGNTQKLAELHSQVEKHNSEIIRYCKIAQNAEQERDQAKNRAGYEVEVLRNEVERLAITAAASEHRATLARQEAEHALHNHSSATVAGIWDSIVAQAIGVAEKADTCQSLNNLTKEKERIEQNCEEFKVELKQLKKDLADGARREKMGVGPVLKEANTLRGKLGDMESKWKAARQGNAKLEAEKLALARENKESQRQLRLQAPELTKVRDAISKAKEATILAIGAEKKAQGLELQLAQNAASLKALEENTKSRQEELSTAKAENVALAMEMEVLGEAKTAAENALAIATTNAERFTLELQACRDQTSQAEEMLTKATSANLRITNSLREDEKKRLTLERELEKSSQGLTSSESNAENLRGRLAESETSLQDLELQFETKNEELKSLVEEVARLQGTVDTLTQENRDTRNESVEMVRLLEGQNQVLEQTEKENAARIMSLSEQNDSVTANLHAAEAALKEAELNMVEVMARNKLMEQEKAALMEDERRMGENNVLNVEQNKVHSEQSRIRDEKIQIISSELCEKQTTISHLEQKLLEFQEELCVSHKKSMGRENQSATVSRLEQHSAKLEHDLCAAEGKALALRREVKDCLERLSSRDHQIMELRHQKENPGDETLVQQYREKVGRREKRIRSLESQLHLLEEDAVVHGEEDQYLIRRKVGSLKAELDESIASLEQSELLVKHREESYSKILVENTKLRQVIKQKDVKMIDMELLLAGGSRIVGNNENSCPTQKLRATGKKPPPERT